MGHNAVLNRLQNAGAHQTAPATLHQNHPHTMPPFPEQNEMDAGLGLPPFIECSNNSRMSACTLGFIFLLLVFYALALWDRWLNLKLRESEKLRRQRKPQYACTARLRRTPRVFRLSK
ncbi:hypothetical protein C8R44DRAFT_180989 [Mycena epipterygia]|nr:hypothetical protein C8R44DRAFT_180989 [Mycena epipterygia]